MEEILQGRGLFLTCFLAWQFVRYYPLVLHFLMNVDNHNRQSTRLHPVDVIIDQRLQNS